MIALLARRWQARAVQTQDSGLFADGIVHRDVKPENLLCALDDPSTIKIIDFGISKPFSRGQLSKYNPLKDRRHIVGSLYCATEISQWNRLVHTMSSSCSVIRSYFYPMPCRSCPARWHGVFDLHCPFPSSRKPAMDTSSTPGVSAAIAGDRPSYEIPMLSIGFLNEFGKVSMTAAPWISISFLTTGQSGIHLRVWLRGLATLPTADHWNGVRLMRSKARSNIDGCLHNMKIVNP